MKRTVFSLRCGARKGEVFTATSAFLEISLSRMRLSFGEFVLNLGTRQVFRGSEEISLSPKAFQLLELLVVRRPDALSKDELQKALWPDAFVGDTSLANLVNELRTAFGDEPRGSHVIRTVHRFGYAFQANARALPSPAAAGAAASGCRLLWGEQEIALAEGENMIGRDPAAAVHVDDVSVSRYHARILIDGSAARIEDLGSKNGTYVRETLVAGAAALRDGDEVRLGSVVMVFHRLETGAPTETASRH
jgi:DNA-binding winged helix-turn-helix (wHTH) protein